ncbi:hypothetical protein CYMTET_45053 [Cymbomonas tetramitiformis]|uniref:Uncharacterized protein n=1 Tax=Cymbomonas tetramitiformis TaxID=36881 RepID=A0AAE0BUL2_9CHLO|nr:hypothetical protein CYMTET_48074 [Cymbomonas tetramitiformis]KAK3245376.1 hypothetical protein CYMTET_45053 [Cymbomonas tetramitiformis]
MSIIGSATLLLPRSRVFDSAVGQQNRSVVPGQPVGGKASKTKATCKTSQVGPTSSVARFRKPARDLRSSVITSAAQSPGSTEGEPDFEAVTRYFGATAFQLAAMSGALWSLDQATSMLAATQGVPAWAPKAVVVAFFAVMSLKSRVFSPLNNSRPTTSSEKAAISERKRPSWMPPPLTFPIVWTTIAVLRTVSSVMIWELSGRTLLVAPILAMMLHLAIGDTWNTINNVEQRLGTAVLGVGMVWASVILVDTLYFQLSTTAVYGSKPERI